MISRFETTIFTYHVFSKKNSRKRYTVEITFSHFSNSRFHAEKHRVHVSRKCFQTGSMLHKRKRSNNRASINQVINIKVMK